MAVNVIALGILGGGVLYLNQFRDELVNRRIEELRNQTHIIAGALGEAATTGTENTEINPQVARQILGRLVSGGRLRARLFGPDGDLLADSRFMFLGQSVIAVELPPPDSEPGWTGKLAAWIDNLLAQVTQPPKLAPYREKAPQKAADYPEVMIAFTGEEDSRLRAAPSGNGAIITVAAPVQRFRRVLGGLMVSAATEDIEALVRSERLAILKIFAVSLGVTLLLSFFLAGTIARPIMRLARAADRVRGGLGREVRLPAYINRDDEIGDLTRSIADMTSALYRQIDAVESFAADVAHEIKNPLSSVRSAVETLQRTQDPELQDKLLGIIKDDVRRLDRLITDISDASRLDAELSRTKMQTFDLGELIDNLVDVYRATAKEGRAEIVYDAPPPGEAMIAGIDGRIGQVVRNIIENAISFSPPDAVIRLATTVEGKIVRTVFDDQGPGLSAHNLEDIFKRFYTERPDSEAFGTHSGLGLSISKQIIEAHRGKIHAENRYREDGETVAGARFVIELPLAR